MPKKPKNKQANKTNKKTKTKTITTKKSFKYVETEEFNLKEKSPGLIYQRENRYDTTYVGTSIDRYLHFFFNAQPTTRGHI